MQQNDKMKTPVAAYQLNFARDCQHCQHETFSQYIMIVGCLAIAVMYVQRVFRKSIRKRLVSETFVTQVKLCSVNLSSALHSCCSSLPVRRGKSSENVVNCKYFKVLYHHRVMFFTQVFLQTFITLSCFAHQSLSL